MNKIKILDEKTINKIAAGEVIERPSSVVKELVENSIDAGATSIIIEIKKGGIEYIRITDNGIGIDENEIEKALLRHATSKISKADDLNNINSLGFRGEALASISAVSRLTLISKTRESNIGKKVEVNGGNLVSNQYIGCPSGTTVIVSNLFFNVPVRKKFLKSEKTEASYITDIIYKLSLSHPNISFKLIRDSKVIIHTQGNNKLLNTIYSIFGKEISESLFEVNYKDNSYSINGYISKTSLTRGNRSFQYLFINRRVVRNEKITKAIENVYKSLIPVNRFPLYFLNLSLDTMEVDVNVHPTKTEIRFSNEELIINLFTKCIKSTLNKNVLIPEISINNSKGKSENIKQSSFIDNYTNNKIDISFNSKENTEDLDSLLNLKKKIKINNQSFNDRIIIKEEGVNFAIDNNRNNNTLSNDPYDDKEKLPEFKIIGTLFSTYILCEGVYDNIFYIIDQHAAHERVNYEKYKEQYYNETTVSQRLLVPEVIKLTNKEFDLVKEHLNTFKRLGFEVEEFGYNSIILRSIPLIFGEPNKTIFIDILDNFINNINNNYEVNIEKIMKLACSNSIKGGDNISKIEIENLISDLSKCKNPFTCPHGRPVIIKMNKYELEKKFKRVK